MAARADDTKSLKSAIVDWIIPVGGCLNPPLSRNVKTDRGFFHERTGALLCPATLDWNNASYVQRLFGVSTLLMTILPFSIKIGLKSGEIAVNGDTWPTFLYRDHRFSEDDPWSGLFEGEILVQVRLFKFSLLPQPQPNGLSYPPVWFLPMLTT